MNHCNTLESPISAFSHQCQRNAKLRQLPSWTLVLLSHHSRVWLLPFPFTKMLPLSMFDSILREMMSLYKHSSRPQQSDFCLYLPPIRLVGSADCRETRPKSHEKQPQNRCFISSSAFFFHFWLVVWNIFYFSICWE